MTFGANYSGGVRLDRSFRRVHSGKTVPLILGEIETCNEENSKDKENHEQTISNIQHLCLYSCSDVVVERALTRLVEGSMK
jgi:hypothetical protein